MKESADILKGTCALELLVQSNRAVVNHLYRDCYPGIRFMITSNSGDIQDAEDVFHDAMVLVLEKARTKTLHLSCSIKTYLYSVSFNMWQRRLYRKSKEITFREEIELTGENEQEDKRLSDAKYDLFRKHFEIMHPEHKRILEMYLSRQSMWSITKEMGYANEKYAKVKKYLCKEQLRKSIQNDPIFKELTITGSN